MPRRPAQFRPVAAALLLSLASLLSCGREITGPGGRGRPAEVLLAPVFPTIRLGGNGQVLGIGEVVDFARVRLVLVRANGDTAVDRLVDFPADSQSIALRLNVVLGDGATNEGEPFQAAMQYISSAGDTVFRAGPATVLARPIGSTPSQPPELPARYVGPGAAAASLTMLPTDFTGTIGQQVTFTTTVRDSAAAVMANVPVAFTSSDSARVRVNLRTGVTTLLGARGNALIVGQTLTGQADTALVTITPTASALVVVSGAGQQVRQGSPFPQPVRVRVNAADGVGVDGVPVLFQVLSGQGTVSQGADTTDANGLAEVTWIAGDSVGVAQLRATVQGTAITATVNGTQLSSSPTALTWEVQPVNIVAGAALPAMRVVVRDATADTVRGFDGPIELTLTGGTAGANLVGVRTVAAVDGVLNIASGLTVDRGGVGYRLVASIAGGPSAPSAAFDAAPTLPANVTLVSGGGQTVPPSTVLPDSVVVRVTDVFGFAKAGVTVNWSIASGGGTTSPTSSVTDATGRAATQWTVGAAGAQQLRAGVGLIEPTIITASIAAGGGAPVLFLPVDQVAVATGRTRPVTVFLTNPTPSPLTVDFVTRSGVATWGAAQLVIPSGGTQVSGLLTGVAAGSTYAVVSSTAGTDSLLVLVDSATAVIDLPSNQNVLVGDTLRTLVLLQEPAPVGGLTVTVRSTDSSRVLVAPGTGLGPQERCTYCSTGSDLRASAMAAPDTTARLTAPPAGTATITIPAGQFSGQLVVLAIAPSVSEGTPVPLTLEATGFVTTGAALVARAPTLNAYCSYCTLAPGQYDELYVTLRDDVRRDQGLRLRSLDPLVATVLDSMAVVPRGSTSPDQYLRVAALAPGDARVEVEALGFAPETVTVRVRPGQVVNFTPSQTGEAGAYDDLYVYLGYDDQGSRSYGAFARDPVTVTVVSRDPAIVAVDRASIEIAYGEYRSMHRIRAATPGSTWLVFSAPGYGVDSTQYVVFGPALDATSNPTQLGVGLVDESFRISIGSGRRNAATPITITSSDPAVARVLTPQVTAAADDYIANARVQGVSLGFATLTVSSPGFDTVTFNLQVVDPSLILLSFTSTSAIDADSALRGVTTYVGTGATVGYLADTLRAVLRSTDPTVLLVTDSLLTAPTGSYAFNNGVVRAIAPGTARLVVSAPGHLPDTSAVVTVRPLRLAFTSAFVTAGSGLITPQSLQRLTPPSAPLITTFALSGPSGATLVQPVDTFPAGTGTISIGVIGGTAVGTDTLVASAPGLASDTILINTVRGRIDAAIPTTLTLGQSEDFVGAFLFAPNFVTRISPVPRKVVLTSRDPGVVTVTQDTIEFAPNTSFPFRLGALLAAAPGTATIVATSVDGTFDADSTVVTVQPPRLMSGTDGTLVMGMQQRTYVGELYIERESVNDAPLWVRLQSSAPGIVSVPDSILMEQGEFFQYFEATAGDTVGTATISFGAPGHAGGSFRVRVTRTQLELYAYYSTLQTLGRSPVEVYTYINDGSTRPMALDVPIRLTARDTLIARFDRDTATLEAGQYSITGRQLLGVGTGITTLTVSDARTTAFARFVSSATDVKVEPARVELGADEYVMAVGGTPSFNVHVSTDYLPDSAWVRLRSLGGRVGFAIDSLLLTPEDSYQPFTMFGLAPGLDTLVLDLPGYRTDTAIVRIVPGVLSLGAALPATIQQGDSVAIQVVLRNADGGAASAMPNPITVSFTTAPNLEVRRGGTVVTSADVPAGQSSVTVWIRGVTAGTATLTASAPGFATFGGTLNIRNRDQ